jgi:hypothetical protein
VPHGWRHCSSIRIQCSGWSAGTSRISPRRSAGPRLRPDSQGRADRQGARPDDPAVAAGAPISFAPSLRPLAGIEATEPDCPLDP